MEKGNGMKQVYDIVLSVPGMNEMVALNAKKISRKNILLLVQVLKIGLASKGEGLMAILPKETIEELNLIASDLLDRANLTETEKLLLPYWG